LTNARDDISALAHTVTGRLTIVASTTPGDYIIPRVLGTFLQEHSQVQVEIAVRDSADAVAAVEEGHADLGVCGAESASNKVVFEEVGRDEIIVIGAPSHEFAGRAEVPFAELVVQDWVVREPGSGTGRMARHALAERRIDSEELRVMVELGSADAVVSAVEGGLGIAMVSSCAAEKALALGTVVRIDMAGDSIVRPFFTVLPKTTASRAAAAFAQHLHQTVSRAESPVFSCR
jgi:DNA-binding transcriptional LysR family regulator